MNSARPTFLVIGAYKAGTTSLQHYLGQHPQIYMSRIKELRFLTYAGHQVAPLTPLECSALSWPVQSIEDYETLFADGAHARARGDISPCYLAFPKQSILGIQACVPQAKIIVILRHPVDRAYSSYIGSVHIGREEEFDFRQSLAYEAALRPRRLDRGQRRNGLESFYSEALSLYYAAFPASQIQVHLYEDFSNNGQAMLAEIFRFIGVDDSFMADLSVQHNRGAWPRIRFLPELARRFERLLFRLIRKTRMRNRRHINATLNRLLYETPPAMDPALRAELIEFYREDILRTQALIHRDLSHWLV